MPPFLFEDKAAEGKAATRYYDWSPVCREIGRPALSLPIISLVASAPWKPNEAQKEMKVFLFPPNSLPTSVTASALHLWFVFVFALLCAQGVYVCIIVSVCEGVLSCILVYSSLLWAMLIAPDRCNTFSLSHPLVHLCFSCTLSITVQPGLTKIMNPSDKRMWAADSASY